MNQQRPGRGARVPIPTSIRQMRPSRTLNPEDFNTGETYRALIDDVVFLGSFVNKDTQLEETKWGLVLREFDLPMKLNGKKMAALGGLYGDNPNLWIGKEFEFYRGIEVVGTQNYAALFIDQRPPAPLKPGLPAADPLFSPQHGRSFVPQANMDRFLQAVAAKGLDWTAFLRWLKTASTQAFAAAAGEPLDAIPASIVPAMKAYLDVIHTSEPAAAPAPAPTLPTPPPASAAFRRPEESLREPIASPQTQSRPPVNKHSAPGYQEIQEDDIPF